jgi:hypothetical protein
MARAEQPPASVSFVRWGEKGFDPERKSGWDVRDHLTQGDGAEWRIAALGELLAKVEPIPEDWVGGRGAEAAKNGSVELECLPCTQWSVLRNSWLKAMHWTDGLDNGLSFCLACIVSTDLPGDQLWGRVMAPASTGKSTIAEALSTAKKYVMALSTMTGFHSGWKTDKDGEEDHSLIAKLRGKTMVTKDGDTLLQQGDLGKTLSEARDLYDRASRVHYKHGMHREHEDLNITWLLFGTASLHSLDQSELGERFLSCFIMEGIDEDMEDEVSARVVARTIRAMQSSVDGDRGQEADMTQAKQLTGGYVEHLRQNARQLAAEISASDDDAVLKRIMNLAKLVACLRARPSKVQDQTSEREFCGRLPALLTRLAMCTAVVLNRRTLDAEVMRRVRKVAFDSSRGVTRDIVRELAKVGTTGATVGSLNTWTKVAETKLRDFLRFLHTIHVAEPFEYVAKARVKAKGPKFAPQGGGQRRWRLATRFAKLYADIAAAEGE